MPRVKASAERRTTRAYALRLAAVFAVIVAISAYRPHYPADWLLENGLVLLTVPALVLAWRRDAFSKPAWSAIFAFLCLHELGAHYTYSEVPYDAWARAVSGQTLNEALGWQRNHYDRLVHFLYGALLVLPLRELLVRRTRIKGAWSYIMPIALIMSTSVIYELIEWGAAEAFGGDLGMAYLGTQGDVWDGHKDMALASLGSVLGMVALGLGARRRR
jgi:putative membrane protein